MKYALPVALLLAYQASAQATLNRPLKRELDSLYAQDQRYRVLLMGINTSKADSLAAGLGIPKERLFTYAYLNMTRADSSNLRRAEALVQRYGYPGKSLVGAPTNEAVWHIIQHSPKISQYLPLIKTAAEKGELPFRLYALMLDRQLMQTGQEQLYGSQGMTFNVHNKTTGQPESIGFIWPIKDAAHVNARRQKAGFGTTAEQEATRMQLPSKPVSLAYAKALQQQAAAEYRQLQQKINKQ